MNTNVIADLGSMMDETAASSMMADAATAILLSESLTLKSRPLLLDAPLKGAALSLLRNYLSVF
jgi:hypothetical protein